MVKILLIEDESGLAAPIKKGLEEEGYFVDHADRGERGLLMALTTEYDLLILDWRLPEMDGITVLERLRGSKTDIPVIMLTAMRDVEYRVAGLNSGADDYLTKPFSFEELLARISALIRRSQHRPLPAGYEPALMSVGSLDMNTVRRTVSLHGTPLQLRMKEYQLLELLMRRAGQVVTRTTIAELVWGSPFDVTDNAIDVTVSNLRQHLSQQGEYRTTGVTIETVRGIGYRFVAASK